MNFVGRMIEFKNLTERDLTNDYYFIQYLGSILDYIERDYKGCLSDLGRMSLAVNITPIYEKFMDDTKPPVSQKELVKFCLYMTNSYAVCVLFKGMTEVFKEFPDTFKKNHNELPDYITNQFEALGERAFDLIDKFKKIMDNYSPLLEGKYRTIFNEEKNKGFEKQIFATQIVSSNRSFMPSELKNAKEVK